jgi:hypothetical protein
MIGVTGVYPHGQAREFAHEVIFEASALNLLGVVEILRANEAHDRVHLKGVIAFGEAIGAGFEGELIPAVMGGCRQG